MKVAVIGFPIKSSTIGGLDSLRSIVQKVDGILVTTAAIISAKNVALLDLKKKMKKQVQEKEFKCNL